MTSIDWVSLNMVQDIIFLIDIFVVFHSVFYDEDFHLIDDRRVIAITYIRGWFFLDLLAIFPTDWLLK